MEVRVVSLSSPVGGSADVVPFTQTPAWGQILKSEGKKVEWLEFFDGARHVGQALVVYMPLPFGWRYAFFPQGPVVPSAASAQALFAYVRSQGCLFLRVEPVAFELFSSLPHTKVIDVNPPVTTILDLTQSLDQLLQKMHQKTRYNIRLAEKKTMTLRHSKDLEILLKLLKSTGQRDGFSLHERAHYEAILASSLSEQITAYEGEIPVATAVFVSSGNTYTYLFGASDYAHRQLMAPYLIQ